MSLIYRWRTIYRLHRLKCLHKQMIKKKRRFNAKHEKYGVKLMPVTWEMLCIKCFEELISAWWKNDMEKVSQLTKRLGLSLIHI